jgi:hypothetical protein
VWIEMKCFSHTDTVSQRIDMKTVYLLKLVITVTWKMLGKMFPFYSKFSVINWQKTWINVVCMWLHVLYHFMERTALFLFPTHKAAVAVNWSVHENNFIGNIIIIIIIIFTYKLILF